MGKARLDSVSVIGHDEKQRGTPLRKNQSSASSGICPTSKRARKLSYVGPTLLDSVQDYIYGEGQKVRTSEERDAFTLALAICGACRRGETDPVASAAYKAFGSTLDRYLKYRSQKQWLQHQGLLRCIPDYDPSLGSTIYDRKSDTVKHTTPLEDNRVRREFQPVATPIIEWPIPETIGKESRDKPPSRGAVGSKPATDSRKFAEVGARTARTRKRGLGAS